MIERGDIFATTSAKHLGLDGGRLAFSRFPNKDVSVVLGQNVEGREVALLSSSHTPAENVIELLFSLDTLFNHGVKKINLVFPYFAYGKSDREKMLGQSVNARAIANVINFYDREKMEVGLTNIHSSKVEKYFKAKVRNLSLLKNLAERYSHIKNLTVVSPDDGGVARAKEFAGYLDIENVVFIKKDRISTRETQVASVSGKVENENVVIVDDLAESGGTILETARFLSTQPQIKNIYVALVHFDYGAGAYVKLLGNQNIKKITTTNTIHNENESNERFEVVDIAQQLRDFVNSFKT